MSLVSLLAAAASCSAATIYDTSAVAELIGSRSAGAGITASGIYAQGFTLSWNIANAGGGFWNYSYTASGYEGRGAGLSHLIIDLTDDCVTPGDAQCVTNPSRSPVELGTFSSSTGNSNPGLPMPIVGVKFDTGGDAPQVFSFTSNRAPVYGDFYAKAGQGYAYNTGNADHTSMTVTNFIPRPDSSTGSAVPEPVSFLLLGGGLVGLRLIRRKQPEVV